MVRPQVQKKMGGVSKQAPDEVKSGSKKAADFAAKRLYDTHGCVYMGTLGVRRKKEWQAKKSESNLRRMTTT